MTLKLKEERLAREGEVNQVFLEEGMPKGSFKD